MTRFRAAWATHEAVGCAVAPKTRIRLVWCSITASTYMRAPHSVTVSKKSHANRASACERRKAAHVLEAFGCGIDTGVLENLPHGRGGDLYPED
jgi:hypothetical protein